MKKPRYVCETRGHIITESMTMHTAYKHGNQALSSPGSWSFGEKLTLLAVVSALADIGAELEEGRAIEALHQIRALHDNVLDEMRAALADQRQLEAFRPLHVFDAALHAVRKTALAKRANAEGWHFRWDGDTFAIADDEAGFFLEVDPSDNWTASTQGTPDFVVGDAGLTTLFAFLNGRALSEEASRLSPWLRRQEARDA